MGVVDGDSTQSIVIHYSDDPQQLATVDGEVERVFDEVEDESQSLRPGYRRHVRDLRESAGIQRFAQFREQGRDVVEPPAVIRVSHQVIGRGLLSRDLKEATGSVDGCHRHRSSIVAGNERDVDMPQLMGGRFLGTTIWKTWGCWWAAP